jgi:2,4-dienoyl-CoA reductase (NADPH2)
MLHSGRYGTHDGCVAPSAVRAPINPFTPHALTDDEVEQTIADHVRCAVLAQSAGYDGVEIMGSEGYLLNQFVVRRTNHRTGAWGGPFEARTRFPLAIVRGVRDACGPGFIVMYRLSLLDLVEDGSTWEETVALARAVEAAGATMINSGIGWHEARIPTIASMVPRSAWTWATARLKGEVRIPLVTTNRINDPALADAIVARGDADMVSMARPFLADPEFVSKARAGRADEINTCIACNQACLDHYFIAAVSTCMLNPRACHETLIDPQPAVQAQRIAVVGGGPAGLAFATTAAERGHAVTLYEAAPVLGGQFNMAKVVPGKEDYAETIRYFTHRLAALGVEVRRKRAEAGELIAEGFDRVVLATGVTPRVPDIAGIEHPSVLSYVDVLYHGKPVGHRVAIVGAGGIGYDVAEFLTSEARSDEASIDAFLVEWGVDKRVTHAGGLAEAVDTPPLREVVVLQRKTGKPGSTLGRTTGWIHKMSLQKKGVRFVTGVTYRRIDDEGLHVTVDGGDRVLPVDSVVICAGQEPLRDLHAPLEAAGIPVDVIGGADVAVELDAKRAIAQAVNLAVAV